MFFSGDKTFRWVEMPPAPDLSAYAAQALTAENLVGLLGLPETALTGGVSTVDEMRRLQALTLKKYGLAPDTPDEEGLHGPHRI